LAAAAQRRLGRRLDVELAVDLAAHERAAHELDADADLVEAVRWLRSGRRRVGAGWRGGRGSGQLAGDRDRGGWVGADCPRAPPGRGACGRRGLAIDRCPRPSSRGAVGAAGDDVGVAHRAQGGDHAVAPSGRQGPVALLLSGGGVPFVGRKTADRQLRRGTDDRQARPRVVDEQGARRVVGPVGRGADVRVGGVDGIRIAVGDLGAVEQVVGVEGLHLSRRGDGGDRDGRPLRDRHLRLGPGDRAAGPGPGRRRP
jgi:hypothetical protein